MSETTEAALPKPIPNYSCTIEKTRQVGQDWQEATVTYGEPSHTLTVREPDMGDQFDLLEIAGGAADSETWMGMALVACAVRSIDGMPTEPGALRKSTLRATIRKLGPVGLAAAGKAIGEISKEGTSTDATVAAAKN